ncbi:MAG: oxidoreductase-like domain-containing protein [Telluria sp.]
MKRVHTAGATVVADPPPPEPRQPALEDCCRSGCTPCVFDLYEEALEHYRKELAAWRLRHPAATPHS